MSEVILTKNCKTSQKDPPPQKKFPLSQKGPMIIQWRSLDFNCGTGSLSLQLFSSYVPVRPLFDKRSTSHDNFVIVYPKKDHIKEEYCNPAETLVNGHFLGSVSREFPVERGSVVERPTFVEELSTCLFNSHCWSYQAGEREETLITQLILRVLQQRIITSGRYHRHWNPIHFKVPNFVTRVP